MGLLRNLSTGLRKVLHIPEATPRFVQIGLTNVCNLNCRMCMRNYFDIDRIHMEYETFTRVVDRLEGAETVILVGFGESLLYPRLYEAIAYCKGKGMQVQLTSNGLLLDTDEKIAQLIRSGLDRFTLSMESLRTANESAHHNSRAAKNIERLIQVKQDLGSRTPRVILQPLLFSDNTQDIYEMIQWAARTGIDRINVSRLDVRYLPEIRRPSMEEEQTISREFARLRRKHRLRIDFLPDQVFDGWKGFLYKHFKFLLQLNTHCFRLQDFVFIDQNDNVFPCCAPQELNMGNMLEQSLQEVWHGEKYRALRKKQDAFEFCRHCDFLKVKQL